MTLAAGPVIAGGYSRFTPEGNSLPNFYFDSYSHEQRLKEIAIRIRKIICYLDEIDNCLDNINTILLDHEARMTALESRQDILEEWVEGQVALMYQRLDDEIQIMQTMIDDAITNVQNELEATQLWVTQQIDLNHVWTIDRVAEVQTALANLQLSVGASLTEMQQWVLDAIANIPAPIVYNHRATFEYESGSISGTTTYTKGTVYVDFVSGQSTPLTGLANILAAIDGANSPASGYMYTNAYATVETLGIVFEADIDALSTTPLRCPYIATTAANLSDPTGVFVLNAANITSATDTVKAL